MSYTTTHTEGQPEASVVAELAQRALEPQSLDANSLYSVRTSSGGVEVLDLERFRERPARKTGTALFSELESFIDYVDDHAPNSDAPTVWVPQGVGTVVAVLNDHTGTEAAFGDHRAELALVETDEWKHWKKLDGQRVSQQEFAEHIEDGLTEIVDPDGATMLELAQSFHASVGGSFTSVQRLMSGAIDMQVKQDVDARAGFDGQIEVPDTFTLQMRPFVGEGPRTVVARLRYRLKQGDLEIGYKLERPDKVIEEAMNAVRGQLSAHFERTYAGQPRR